MTTKLHRPSDEIPFDVEEANRLYHEYYTHDNPLQEYNHFIIEAHGFSRDFLAHISRDTKFLRMWVGSGRVSPDGVDFVDKDMYYTPRSITGAKSDVYHVSLIKIQHILKECADAGFTTEELKHLTAPAISLPITLSGSFRSIRDMCEKRACIHCQDHWQEFIGLLADEFKQKVDPWLANMLYKPKCIQKRSCHVKMEVRARTEKWPDGRWKDPLEICPLYIRFERKDEIKELEAMANEKHPKRNDMIQRYYKFLKGEF